MNAEESSQAAELDAYHRDKMNLYAPTTARVVP